jgi:hypothetical protein
MIISKLKLFLIISATVALTLITVQFVLIFNRNNDYVFKYLRDPATFIIVQNKRQYGPNR